MSFRILEMSFVAISLGAIMPLGIVNEADYFKYKSSLTTEHKQILLRSVANPTVNPTTAET